MYGPETIELVGLIFMTLFFGLGLFWTFVWVVQVAQFICKTVNQQHAKICWQQSAIPAFFWSAFFFAAYCVFGG